MLSIFFVQIHLICGDCKNWYTGEYFSHSFFINEYKFAYKLKIIIKHGICKFTLILHITYLSLVSMLKEVKNPDIVKCSWASPSNWFVILTFDSCQKCARFYLLFSYRQSKFLNISVVLKKIIHFSMESVLYAIHGNNFFCF